MSATLFHPADLRAAAQFVRSPRSLPSPGAPVGPPEVAGARVEAPREVAPRSALPCLTLSPLASPYSPPRPLPDAARGCGTGERVEAEPHHPEQGSTTRGPLSLDAPGGVHDEDERPIIMSAVAPQAQPATGREEGRVAEGADIERNQLVRSQFAPGGDAGKGASAQDVATEPARMEDLVILPPAEEEYDDAPASEEAPRQLSSSGTGLINRTSSGPPAL